MRYTFTTLKYKLIFFAVCITLFAGCAPCHIPDNCESLDRYAPGKAITFKEYAQSLPTNKIAVGFDIDDTILFSSPGFYYGKTNIDGCKNKKNKDCKKNIFKTKESFLEYMNNGLDEYNPPKAMALALLDLHAARGDKVYIITAREETTRERVTEILKNVITRNHTLKWNNQFVEPVIFTNLPQAKNKYIKHYGISIYYGDADTDMSQAITANAKPIRILRSPASNCNTPAQPGIYGEKVLINSEF